jgi:hypothetical protein
MMAATPSNIEKNRKNLDAKKMWYNYNTKISCARDRQQSS